MKKDIDIRHGVSFDSRKKKIKKNDLKTWGCVLLSIFTANPLPIDPIPFFGVPAFFVGAGLMGVAMYFGLKKDVLIEQAIIQLARENENEITALSVVEYLDMKIERAERFLEKMAENRIFIPDIKETPDGVVKIYRIIT